VFASIGRADEVLERGVSYARGDLYVSRRAGDHWTAATRLTEAINTRAAETSPSITADGRLLFVSEAGFATLPFERDFSYAEFAEGAGSVRNGLGNIYEIDLRSIELGQ
jgi:hypothetical protein